MENCTLTVTPKIRILLTHLIDFLRRFKGLDKYDEEFIEWEHQRGSKKDWRAFSVKNMEAKAKLHATWELLDLHRDVLSALQDYN